MHLGNLEVLPLLDGQIVFPAPQGVPPNDSPEFVPHRRYITEDGRFLMDIGAFIVRSRDRVVLIDAGAGPGTSERIGLAPFSDLNSVDPELVAYNRRRGLDGQQLIEATRMMTQMDFRTGLLGRNLARLGIKPEDVTDVVLSHLHFDHVGWVSRDGNAYFPNATYRCERRDAEHFLRPNADDETISRLLWNTIPAPDRMKPVLSRLEPWDGDCVIADGINACFAPGHTPGSCIFILSSKAERAMILGDSVHCPLELTDSDFSLMTDMDQALADRTRERIRREIEDGETLVSAPHFPELRFGRMLPGKGKLGWTFL